MNAGSSSEANMEPKRHLRYLKGLLLFDTFKVSLMKSENVNDLFVKNSGTRRIGASIKNQYPNN